MPDGSKVEIGSHCQIGRLPGSAIRIDSAQVSRQHASVHVQQSGTGDEYWLADLGSTNGTVLKGRRLTIPTRLRNGDEFMVGSTRLVFGQDESVAAEADGNNFSVTRPMQASRYCWLVMVDIKRFTNLTLTVAPDALGQMVGNWIRRTRQVIELNGGIVDKLLGDAVFAYWEAGPDAGSAVAKALDAIRDLQAERSPDFRVVVHLGPALFAGQAGGANNISGLEVIYVFRMEKICANLELDSIFSEVAKEALDPQVSFESVGEHSLDGFSGKHALFKSVGTHNTVKA